MSSVRNDRTRDALIARHAELSDELSGLLNDSGMTRAQITRAQASAWDASYSLPVTERREAVRHACSEFIANQQDTDAQMESLRVELHHLDIAIKHARD